MTSIGREMDEEMYHETTMLHRRHLTDQVLRVRLKHINPPGAIIVEPETTIQETVTLMKKQRQGAVLVCGKGTRKVAGIFTERDLLLRVAGQGWDYNRHTVQEVMTRNPECLTPRDLVGLALNMMMTHGYRHIPIANPKGEAMGLLSVRHLLAYLGEHFPEDVLNLPPPGPIPTEREGG